MILFWKLEGSKRNELGKKKANNNSRDNTNEEQGKLKGIRNVNLERSLSTVIVILR